MDKEIQRDVLKQVYIGLQNLELRMSGKEAKIYSDAIEALGIVHDAITKELQAVTEEKPKLEIVKDG